MKKLQLLNGPYEYHLTVISSPIGVLRDHYVWSSHVNTLGGGNDCYETIMFGRVTHTLDAAAKRVRSFVLRQSHSVTSPSVVL